jgi:YidC/Oxa1 family membrane protein insertase
MERRALIAVIISVLILVLYQEVVLKHWYPSAPTPRPTEVAAPPAAAPPAAAPGSAERPVEASAPPPPGVPAAAPVEPGADVVVDTELYHAVFTTTGARLKSFELKQFRTTVDPNSPPLQLVQYPIANQLPLGVALVGAQQLDDAAVAYRVDTQRVDVPTGGTATITFSGELAGAAIRKRVEIRGGLYTCKMDVEVANPPEGYSELAVGWEEGMNPAGPHAAEVVFDSIVVLQAGKLHTELFTAVADGKLLQSDVSWTAFSGRYFLAAQVPGAEPPNQLRAWQKRTDQTVEAQLLWPPKELAVQVELYVGPKDIDLLEAAGHGLRRAVDLGWFTFVALPMLQALRFLHRFTGNFGVAIIVLTVVIKLLFYPLTQKSFESMRAMQKLQPDMAKIRERLKDKPEEMNREVMELYKRHKVNPLGGCLPMLLQLPVFIGLYSALQNAIELRHAPFIGWITDLSAPDRLGSIQLPFVDHPGIPVLTLLMGVSMFVQQWMTPSAADPQQQRIMMIMPIMFTFMFINFPAGLTLYWLVNNVLTIGQQYLMMRSPQR